LAAVRQAGAAVAGGAVAAVGALVLGEYDFEGAVVIVMGVLFGLAVVEVALWLADRPPPWLAAVVAVEAGGGLLWAGWISVHHRGVGVPGGAYVAALVGAGTAGFRGWSAVRSARSRTRPAR
jgi:hypothetical protein